VEFHGRRKLNRVPLFAQSEIARAATDGLTGRCFPAAGACGWPAMARYSTQTTQAMEHDRDAGSRFAGRRNVATGFDSMAANLNA
jgi:hypothetical protein